MLKSTNGLRRIDKNKFLILLKSAFCVALFILLHSCGAGKYSRLNKKLNQVADLKNFDNHQFGILVYDPQKKDTLIKINADKYFIPASNAKIFTLYTALKLLPDSLPAIRYLADNDTIYFQGLGDPTLLHSDFQDSTSLKFLNQYQELYFSTSNFNEDPWPAGWSWEDFDRSYAVERSSLPIYGNRLTVFPGAESTIRPPLMKDSIRYGVTRYYRERASNLFYVPIVQQDSLEIPLKIDFELIKTLLSAELDGLVHRIDPLPEGNFQTIYGSARDTVLRTMMIQSDNFLAEQLLLNASSVLSDTLSSRKAINYMLENKLQDLVHLPRWVDGSGLSRYNLFTPTSMVDILSRMYDEYELSYTLGFFPVGGVSGTLEDHYRGKSNPYVFAKSGTLGNTYCLSGYLQTNSGKLLIFSIMNNNFRLPLEQVKNEIGKILEWLREEN